MIILSVYIHTHTHTQNFTLDYVMFKLAMSCISINKYVMTSQ